MLWKLRQGIFVLLLRNTRHTHLDPSGNFRVSEQWELVQFEFVSLISSFHCTQTIGKKAHTPTMLLTTCKHTLTNLEKDMRDSEFSQ